MRHSKAFRIVMTASLLGLVGPTARATPLSSAFTYQGYLTDSGAPFNGTADFQFSLWDDPAQGSQIGATQSIQGVQVTDGVFTVVLNDADQFGQSAFTGQQRWLEIAVNQTTLSPRQPITAAPYALFALSGAGSGDSLWTQNGSNVYYDSGSVGIGTATPAVRLHVSGGGGDARFDVGAAAGETSAITLVGNRSSGAPQYAGINFGNLDSNGTSGLEYSGAFIRSFNASDDDSGDLTFWTKDTNDTSPQKRLTIAPAGNVGIGTSNPASTLEVNGTVTATSFIGDGSGLTSVAGVWTESGDDLYHDGGNVGIGTATPAVRLHVSGGGGDARFDVGAATGDTSAITLVGSRSSGAPQYAGINFGNLDTNGTSGLEYSGAFIRSFNASDDDSGDLTFWTKDTDDTSPEQRLTIDPAGNVGIGTSNPASTLEVNGTVTATSFIGDGSGLTSVAGVWTESGNDLYFDGGNVGIGTATPAVRLHVSGGGGDARFDVGAATGDTAAITLVGSRSSGVTQYAGINFGNLDTNGTSGLEYSGAFIRSFNASDDDSGDLTFWTKDTNDTDPKKRLTIAPAGNVGIGISSPDTMLHAVDSTASNNDPAILGVHTQGLFGIGVQGEGGSVGVNGVVVNTGNGTFKGVAGTATGGSSGTNYGIYGEASGGTNAYAGWFQGNAHVNGVLSKSSGAFKIDHPLDPANKYLWHSFVESPDMMNIYNGNVVTDGKGYATVQLPDWFESLNRDFRYQLTAIGSFARAMVAEEVKNNAFVIRTDLPNVKVSWQVTGIRHDAAAEANRIPVEQVKPDSEKGSYLHPELFGQPEDHRVDRWLDTQRSETAPPKEGKR